MDVLQFMDGIDAILLGANTYKLFVDFWPVATTEQEVIADKLNLTHKIVFSSRMQKAPWGKWPDATLIHTSAIDAVKKLKSQQGKDMVLWGSISLAQNLIKENLVDEFHFRICPLVLGHGRRMFEHTNRMDFELIQSKQYPSGLMLLQYTRVTV